MAQPLQSINLVAPAFKGVNTEDSPIGQDVSFAEIADNAIIDKSGRIASRKGVALYTTDKTELGSDYINKVHYFYDDTGSTNEVVFSTGNNKIMTGTTTLVDATPGSYTPTGDNWKIVNFNNKAYFFQRGHEPLVYDDANGLRTFGTATGTTTDTKLYCHEALAAYGRLWVVDNSTQAQVIYWSDLLIGTDFTGGSSGSIDVSKAWPDGRDEVKALVAHNNALIVLGKHSILVYGDAYSPATMALADTVAGVGCICRNSVQHIGTDVLFMSPSGLRSFGRTIQEKSLPLSDLSLNIKTELIGLIEQRTVPTTSVYSPENSFYLITFPDTSTTYCFDLKARLENGAYRVTRWPSSPFKSFDIKTDGTILVGTTEGIGQYSGYSDLGNSYLFKYYSPQLTFGDTSKTKLLKKLRPTVVGGNSAIVFMKWAYDFDTAYRTQSFIVGNQVPAYYGVDEYPEYSELSSYGISSSLVGGVYVVNKYLGKFASEPTTGSGGGVILNGDSYVNTTDGNYYVYISGAWTDLDTLTPSTVAEFTGGETTTRPSINTTGQGSVIAIGLECEINGFALSLQEINVLALIGKTI